MKIKNFRRVSTAFFALMLVFVLSIGTAGTAFAVVPVTIVDVTGDYELTTGNIELHITGTSRIWSDGTEYSYVKMYYSGGTDLAIENLNINNGGGWCPLYFGDSAYNLTITGTNTLIGGYNEAAVRVEGTTALTIDGTGELSATGGEDAAGIGGRLSAAVGTITINGATINATGGLQGAGIGSGEMGTVGTINITGGTIIAAGSIEDCAGIGGGYEASDGIINISGGIIDATGSTDAAGIGAGDYGDGTMVININGGEITAQGGENGTGIGTGSEYESTGDMTINISGGTIEATGGADAAGIGYGDYGDGALTINISGGTTYAYGGEDGAGIGSGASEDNTDNSVLNIMGGWVYAYGSVSAGIGGGESADFGTINFSGGVTNAFSEYVDDIGRCFSDIIDNAYLTGTTIVFPLTNYLYENADTGIHSHVLASLDESSFPVPTGTEIVLETYDGLYAKTWVAYMDGEAYVWLPDGTYFFSKDNGAMRTQDFVVDGSDIEPELEFVSVLLGNLDISEGALSPAFDSTTFEYGVDVGADIESINVTPTLLESSDDVTVNGVPVENGTASGEIALSVGTNVIEITVSDEEFPQTSNTYTVTVTREAGSGPYIQGALYDGGDNLLVGWTVVLESTPVTVVTDGLGQFSFTNVTLEDHTLTIKDTGGNIIKVYNIQFTEGEPFSWSEVNGTLFITITPGTAGVDIQIEVGDPTLVESITEIIDNPDTGGSISYTWLWAALAALVLLAGAVFIRKAVKNN